MRPGSGASGQLLIRLGTAGAVKPWGYTQLPRAPASTRPLRSKANAGLEPELGSPEGYWAWRRAK